MSEVITTYLKDHHAGATAGLEVFDRVASSHSDLQVREAVAAIAREVREDRQSLEEIMQTLGIDPSLLKDTASSLGEKVARLKPNEHLAQRSPLSDLVELEALVLGVRGKRLLWKSLLAVGDPRLDHGRLNELVERAETQENQLEALRLSQAPKLLQS